MIVLISVLALVVVNALKASPWGTVTIGLTIPIAMFLGVYLRWLRPGRVLEASAIGVALLVLALYAGRWVAESATLAPVFTLSGTTLALLVMAYGFAASVLPVWLLLAPRDYLSAFHALIASGTTPKILERESDARLVGYGGMLTESLVAIMALIAACVLTPGVYFAINAPVAALGTTAESAARAVQQWGFTVTPQELHQLAR